MRTNTDKKINDLLKNLKSLSIEEQIDSIIELYIHNKITLEEFKTICFELNIQIEND